MSNIRDFPREELPRERLIRHEVEVLTNTELLAVIIKTGNKKDNVIELSRKIMKKYGLNKLSKLTVNELKKHLGIGNAKACQILACFELGKRLLSNTKERRIRLNSAKEVAEFIAPKMIYLEKEKLKALFLDSRKKLIKTETISIGSLNESIIHPREIFRSALKENAAAIIIVHNHPSGDPTPSKDDIKITKQLIKCGKMIGIPILDHIIIGKKGYISLCN